MAQRIMIAMAIAGKPEMLIADEPTTALDVTIQLQILKLLKDLQKQNNTAILFVTHDLAVVSQVSDKIQVLYAGEIVEQGRTTEIISNPSHPYTQGLLKSLPSQETSDKDLYSIDGMVPSLFDRPIGCQFAPRCEYVKDICEKALLSLFAKMNEKLDAF